MVLEKRNIGICVLLSIVTCGVYSLYWFYCIASDIYRAGGEENKAGMDLVLGIVTCGIYLIYIYYIYGKKMDYIRERYGIPARNDSILYVILSIFGLGIITHAIIQHNLNEEINPLLGGWSSGPAVRRDDRDDRHN
jgi:hypothetical protein